MAKINVNVPKMGIVMLLLFMWVAVVDGSNGKINGRIDLVIIAPAAHGLQGSGFIDAFKNSFKNVHKHIEMGDEKVRVAVVEPVHYALTDADVDVPGAQILFNMSSNQVELENWANNWNFTAWNVNSSARPFIPFWHGEAFELADRIFFNKTTDKSRAKMIIQVVNGRPHDNDRQKAYDEAKKLREKGVLIYVTYDGTIPPDYVQAYVDNYPWRMYGSNLTGATAHFYFFKNALENILKLTTEIIRDLCTFCKFNDKKQDKCKPEKRPKGSEIDYFGDGNAQCGNVDPTAIPCPKEECHFECDRQWPWSSPGRPCSNPNAMPCILDYVRSGDVKVGLENCPKEMRCSYTCPTTTTPTTTPNNIDANQVKTSKPEESNTALIIILSVIGGVIIIIIVLIVVIVKRSAAAKKKALWDLEQFKKKRAEDKAKHRHQIVTAGGKKGVRDAMAVSLVSKIESVKPICKSPRKISGKSMASSTKKGGETSKVSSPMKKVG